MPYADPQRLIEYQREYGKRRRARAKLGIVKLATLIPWAEQGCWLRITACGQVVSQRRPRGRCLDCDKFNGPCECSGCSNGKHGAEYVPQLFGPPGL